MLKGNTDMNADLNTKPKIGRKNISVSKMGQAINHIYTQKGAHATAYKSNHQYCPINIKSIH